MENFEKAIRALMLTNLREVEQPEQVQILATAGYKPAEIGELLGLKPNTVAKALARARKGESE